METSIRKLASANWYVQFKLIYTNGSSQIGIWKLACAKWHLQTGISKLTGFSKPASPNWDLQMGICKLASAVFIG